MNDAYKLKYFKHFGLYPERLSSLKSIDSRVSRNPLVPNISYLDIPYVIFILKKINARISLHNRR